MKHLPASGLLTLLACAIAAMAPRGFASTPPVSEHYQIDHSTLDAGGHVAAGGSYRQDSSIGGISGVSQSSAGEMAKQGFTGQLVEPVSFGVTAAATSVTEGSTLKLDATLHLDDGTLTKLKGPSVWSILSGPVDTIDAAGLVQAGHVYQTTTAAVRGMGYGFSADLQFSVLNVTNDDFGLYADDGIEDMWQIQYFGLDNPAAGPTRDASGTGQNNLFKFTAGLNPLDPASRFVVTTDRSTITGQMTLTLSPCLPDRTYRVMSSGNLFSWTPLPQQPAGIATERAVTDFSAGGTAKFYRVEITRP